MIRWFKWCMGAVIAVLVVWWLNIPFSDSQRDDAPLIVTSTPITQHLVETIMGPKTQIVSLVDRLKDPLPVKRFRSINWPSYQMRMF